ncbi:microcystin-dependent protein [Azospirillum fermentarium]|uniref:phage tail protein n=1 Tax=Azospirillum fermentarium TaxID=1233114 RepID=UPI0022279E50|nr:tail fiber protein [Azospirillum fermentarium]MCW2249584.1 microcystin-dependent protein [Azospirillum fermentarium]
MAEPFLGEIRVFSFGKIPSGWLPCDGRTLQVAQYQALYSLLGNTFGGTGPSTFNLPDLRGRTPVCMSFTPPVAYQQGNTGGTEAVVLNGTQVPGHVHPVNVYKEDGAAIALTNNFLAKNKGPSGVTPFNVYASYDASKAVALNSATIQPAGGNGGHENRQPSLALSYCIAVSGNYPTRP